MARAGACGRGKWSLQSDQLEVGVAQVGATEFKARCLELMDRVAERRETYVITKRGKPVAKLVPADPPAKKGSFGCMAGEMEIVGDLAKSPWSDEEWQEIERQRTEQWRAWDLEWQQTGKISGRATRARSPRKVGRRAARERQRR